MTKMTQDNYVTYSIGAVYTKNETILSWLIGQDAVCNENQIKQLLELGPEKHDMM